MNTEPPPELDPVVGGGRARRRRRNVLVAASCVLAGVVVVACGDGAPQQDASDSEAPIVSQPTDSPMAFPEADEPVALEAGTYLVSGAVAGGDTPLASYTLTVPAGWTGDSGSDLKQVWDGYFVFPPNHSASLYVVDVAGRSLVLLVGTADGVSAADRTELQSILDSIRFEQVE